MRQRRLGLVVWVVVIAVSPGAAGCASSTGSSEATGSAQAEVRLAPANASCLIISVSHGSSAGDGGTPYAFDLAPSSNTTFFLGGLRLGRETFSAVAFDAPCAATSGQSPTWLSNTVTTTLVSGVVAQVTLEMTPPNAVDGGAVIGVDFRRCSDALTEFDVPVRGLDGIASGPDGNLWVTAGADELIGKVTLSGTFQSFPAPGMGAPGGPVPVGITAGADGNLWFTEVRGNAIGQVTTDGVFQLFPLPNPLRTPEGIATGPDGNLWFAEGSGSAIGQMTTSGALKEFPLPAGTALPLQIAAGSDGAMWFTATSSNQIGRLALDGTFVMFTPPSSGGLNGIAAGPDGNIWYTSGIQNTIGRVTPAGVFQEFPIPTPASDPRWIASGPDGNIWFTETHANKVGRMMLDGTFVEYVVPTPVADPWSITAGPDGNVWFTELAAGKIGRITPYVSCPPDAGARDAGPAD